MTDKEIIIAYIDKLLKKYPKNYHLLTVAEFIDSLQEESVSEELEEAADNCYFYNHAYARESFIEGAKWDREQMMSKAIDGYVIEDIEEGNGDFLLSADYLPKSMNLKDRQKVKVIVIKED